MILAPAYAVGGTAGGGGSTPPGPGGALAVTVTPLVAYGSRASAAAVTVISENITLTITGGSGTYTISWVPVSTPSGTWTITNPTGLVTKFARASVAAATSYVGSLKANVSDGLTSVTSSTVEVNLDNTGYL